MSSSRVVIISSSTDVGSRQVCVSRPFSPGAALCSRKRHAKPRSTCTEVVLHGIDTRYARLPRACACVLHNLSAHARASARQSTCIGAFAVARCLLKLSESASICCTRPLDNVCRDGRSWLEPFDYESARIVSCTGACNDGQRTRRPDSTVTRLASTDCNDGG